MGATGTALPPTIDDTLIWDTWLAQFRLPIVNTALDAGVIAALCDEALDHAELAARLGLDPRALKMWLAALCPMGFVERRLGKWRATAAARTWLHPQAKGYWGGFLKSIDRNDHLNTRLAESLRTGVRRRGPTRARRAGKPARCRRKWPTGSPASCRHTARARRSARRGCRRSASSPA